MIKNLINMQLMQLPSQFLDVTEAKALKADITAKLHMGPENIFARQSFLDRAKQVFKKREVQAIKSLYFAQFIHGESFDWKSLDQDFSTYKHSFERHLGRDWVFFISTLLKVSREANQMPMEVKVDNKPKGLLNLVN